MKNFNRAIQRHCKIFLIQVTKITNLRNKLKPNPHKSGQPHQNLDFLMRLPWLLELFLAFLLYYQYLCRQKGCSNPKLA